MARSLSAFVAACALTAPAHAGFLAVTTEGGHGVGVSITYNGTTLNNVYAGTVTARYTAADPDTNPGLAGIQLPANHFAASTFGAYCVNLDEFWASNPFAYQVAPTALPNPGLGGANSALVAALVNTYAASVTTANQRAALQLAVWEARYDGSANLAAGTFRFTGDATLQGLANGYLAGAAGVSAAAIWYRPTPAGRGFQDMVGLPTPLPGGGRDFDNLFSPAPAPGTAVLLMAAAPALGVARLRRAAARAG